MSDNIRIWGGYLRICEGVEWRDSYEVVVFFKDMIGMGERVIRDGCS